MLLGNETPTGDKLLGHVIIRIPIYEVTESESWEIPEEYTYLATGESELVSHDIPTGYHEWLMPSQEMLDWEITPENWTKDEISATYSPASPSD
jgi:hypothetical protein